VKILFVKILSFLNCTLCKLFATNPFLSSQLKTMALPTVGIVVSQAMGSIAHYVHSKLKKMKVTITMDDESEKQEQIGEAKTNKARSSIPVSLVNEWKRLHKLSQKSLRPEDQLLADEYYHDSLTILMKMENNTKCGGKQFSLHSFQRHYQFKYERLLLVSTTLQEVSFVEQEIQKLIGFQRSSWLSVSQWEDSKIRIHSIFTVEYNVSQNSELNMIQLRNLLKVNSQVYWHQRNQIILKLIDEILSSPLEELKQLRSNREALKERIESLKRLIPEESFSRDSDLRGFFRIITDLKEEIQQLRQSTKNRNSTTLIAVAVIIIFVSVISVVLFYHLSSGSRSSSSSQVPDSMSAASSSLYIRKMQLLKSILTQ
jgi:hypothetical protein